MNDAGVNATTNMTMECSIFYFRRLAPPPPRSRLLSQHESNSPISSPPTLFIQIYSRFPPKFALARPMDRGSKDDRETGREEGGQTNEGLIQHETVAGCDSVEGGEGQRHGAESSAPFSHAFHSA